MLQKRLDNDLALPGFSRPVQFDARVKALEAFEPTLQLHQEGAVVDVVGFIGPTIWDDASLRSVDAQLRQAGDSDITVRINSPGGDFFEGQAIYNALRNHKGRVTTQVMGIAASAASVIAMAGDEIVMSKTSWLMIHNVWSVIVGDKNVLKSAIADMEKFDQVTADLYQARTGLSAKEITAMMDAETFLSGAEAVDKGFATRLSEREPAPGDEPSQRMVNLQANARKIIDVSLAKAGYARSDRRAMIEEAFGSARNAASGQAAHDAGDGIALASLRAGVGDIRAHASAAGLGVRAYEQA